MGGSVEYLQLIDQQTTDDQISILDREFAYFHHHRCVRRTLNSDWVSLAHKKPLMLR